MIFVTVGTDLPFNRLVQAVDAWAGKTGRQDVFAQIGATPWRPKHIRWQAFLEPQEYRHHFSSAHVIVSHAGMGTILSALQFGKPILIMPRRAALREQRNDHQLATARHFAASGKVTVAIDDGTLRQALSNLDALVARTEIGAFASPELIRAIKEFTFQTGPTPIDTATRYSLGSSK